MAFDFPSNPAPDTVFTSSDGTTVYVWNGYAWMMGGGASPGVGGSVLDDYVLKAGDVMTGYLTLSGDPLDPQHAATKEYVDAQIAGLTP